MLQLKFELTVPGWLQTDWNFEGPEPSLDASLRDEVKARHRELTTPSSRHEKCPK